MAQDPVSSPRLYTRFISILKILQYVGYSIVVLFTILFITFSLGPINVPGSPGVQPVAILIAVLQAAIFCAIIYVITQGLIAIIDLLSRIEANTRSS